MNWLVELYGHSKVNAVWALILILRCSRQLSIHAERVHSDDLNYRAHVYPAARIVFNQVFLDVGDDIGYHVTARILRHLRTIPRLEVSDYSEWEMLNSDARASLHGNTLLLSLGTTVSSGDLISRKDLEELPFESFVLAGKPNTTVDSTARSGILYRLASNGRTLDATRHQNISFSKSDVNYGAVVGAYAALETLGFSFLHPLRPYVPSVISISNHTRSLSGSGMRVKPSTSSTDWFEIPARRNASSNGSTGSMNGIERGNSIGYNMYDYIEATTASRDHPPSGEVTVSSTFEIHIVEYPRWPERVFHIHTQHPLELTEVLQGHDIPQFGPHGPHCQAFTRQRRAWSAALDYMNINSRDASPSRNDLGFGFSGSSGSGGAGGGDALSTYCERWEDMVADVDTFFEWAVANRQNKVEWLLLGNYKWGDESSTRHRRLRQLTWLGHQYSLMVGADCPLGNIQQHAWYMVNVRLPIKQQREQIRERVDWIFNAGFDFLTTESGLSEFTHPECDLMLDLLNTFTEHVNVTWGREAGVKVHCSTGQTCGEHFLDPRSGDPLNFNFLPTYAHTGLGVFPHTVQVYALDDPTAGAYGNQNFSYMEDYVVYEAKKGNRSVVFYGETAYWVNVDIDVPLFLPIYGQRRLHDLRRIAVREEREHFHIDGQMNFDSGWEWGYWLSGVVTARAVWNPVLPDEYSHYRRHSRSPAALSPSQSLHATRARAATGEGTAFSSATGELVQALCGRENVVKSAAAGNDIAGCLCASGDSAMPKLLPRQKSSRAQTAESSSSGNSPQAGGMRANSSEEEEASSIQGVIIDLLESGDGSGSGGGGGKDLDAVLLSISENSTKPSKSVSWQTDQLSAAESDAGIRDACECRRPQHNVSHSADGDASSTTTTATTSTFRPPYSRLLEDYQARDDEWDAFSLSIEPLTRVFGPAFGARLNNLLVSLSKAEADLLIYGKINGKPSPNHMKLSGIAYMSGSDTWVDVPRLFGMAFLQPDKVHLKEMQDKDWPHAMELLRAMDLVFGSVASSMSALLVDVLQTEMQRRIMHPSSARGVSRSVGGVVGGGDGGEKRRDIDSSSEGLPDDRSSGIQDKEKSGAKNGSTRSRLLRLMRRYRSPSPSQKKGDGDGHTNDGGSAGGKDGESGIDGGRNLTAVGGVTYSFEINDAAIDILVELDDCTRLLALRARHLLLLYESKDARSLNAIVENGGLRPAPSHSHPPPHTPTAGFTAETTTLSGTATAAATAATPATVTAASDGTDSVVNFRDGMASSDICEAGSADAPHSARSPLVTTAEDRVKRRSQHQHSEQQSNKAYLQGGAWDPMDVAVELQRESRRVIQQAQEVVHRREELYKVPWQRIGSWRENPTVYRYGYLWAVHSLYYWWREQGLAEAQLLGVGTIRHEHSPCYLNRMDVTEVAVGWGQYTLEILRTFINRYTPLSVGGGYGYVFEFVNCLSPPARGYEFPKDLCYPEW